jgi:TolB protein
MYRLSINRPRRVQRVTHLDGIVEDPAWSPDGRRVAFRWFHPRTQRVGLYVANASGRHVRLLVNNGVTPAWSPNGREIAYAHGGSGGTGISVINVADALQGHHAPRAVTTTFGDPQEYPVWSPDGKKILFSGFVDGSYDIFVVDADGTNLHDLTPNPGVDYLATWSPDGSEIVFGSNRNGANEFSGDLYKIDATGGHLRRLTSSRKNYGPAWSPDGRWIAFNSSRVGNSELYLMRPDGSHQRRLTRSRKDDAVATWIGRCPEGTPTD